MTRRLARFVIPIALLSGCSGHPARSPVDAQEAAVTFLLGQRSRQQPACVLIATGPGDLEQGLVAKNLQEPPPEFLRGLSSKGLNVHPSLTCSAQGGTPIMLRVGWPSSTPDGYEVPVDLFCGPLGCDRGTGCRSTGQNRALEELVRT